MQEKRTSFSLWHSSSAYQLTWVGNCNEVVIFLIWVEIWIDYMTEIYQILLLLCFWNVVFSNLVVVNITVYNITGFEMVLVFSLSRYGFPPVVSLLIFLPYEYLSLGLFPIDYFFNSSFFTPMKFPALYFYTSFFFYRVFSP